MAVQLFFSYSHKDEALRDQLEVHLAMLKRQDVIDPWHDRRIGAGKEIDPEIMKGLEQADIILFLVSPDFLASDYCYEQEVQRAMERHEAGEAQVIPVILRPCDWHPAPFGKLLATPTDGKPVTQFPDIDVAFLEVTGAIRAAAEELGGPPGPSREPEIAPATRVDPAIRSSNLRVAKEFTEADRDRFLDETYEYIVKFFQNSLDELQHRNDDIELRHNRIDQRRFTAAVYRKGEKQSACTIFVGGLSGQSISYALDDAGGTNSYNESLSIEHDEQKLFWKTMGMIGYGEPGEQMSMEGAAEFLWSLLIEPLQGGSRRSFNG